MPAHRGKRQLERFVGQVGGWRQVLLAGAILVLILFEGLMAILIGDRGAGVGVWCAAAAIYFVYLGLVAAAAWPTGAGS